MLWLKALLTCGLLLVGEVLAADWSYSGEKGPSNWAEIAQECGHNQQSPINIYEGDLNVNTRTDPFVFGNYSTSLNVEMSLRNNGHTVNVVLSGSTPITLSGGGLPSGTYRAIQFHFHWGNDSDTGSEHLVNSKAYPMEVHIVHFNNKYRDVSEALRNADGLAVLGFMYEVSPVDNANYSMIVNNLASVTNTDPGTISIPSIPLMDLLPQTFQKFYRYSGSLTTPSCQESVTWTVFKEPINISEQQLQKFRTLRDSHNKVLVNNYRPVQTLNFRTVEVNFKPDIQWAYSTGHIDVGHWDDYYSNCGGDRQSPIDIQPAYTQHDTRINNFTYHNYSSTTGLSLQLRNNGHTASVIITDGDIGISEGGLSEAYKLAQFHLHWGSSDIIGSEHTLNGHAYPMEIHFVHFKKSLRTLLEAAAAPDGLAVLGVFFEISSKDNPALKPIIDYLPRIIAAGSTTSIPSIALSSFLPQNKNDFYRYNGSLTTPRCLETVIWTVFKDTIKISPAQLATFRSLQSSEKDDSGNTLSMVDNFRPVQKLHNRVVLTNFVASSKVHWTYHGETGYDQWHKEYSKCSDLPSSRQSPINLQPQTGRSVSFRPFNLKGYSSAEGITMEIKNNGHTAVIKVSGDDIVISGGGLEGSYKVKQLHFHWGLNSKQGSEHLIENKAYPMEMHLVHRNTIYPNISAAVNNEKGLAVFGFMYEISDEDNPNYEAIISKLSEIQMPDSKTSLPAMPLESILPRDLSSFYRYQGSLTTPSCHEAVTWTVFRSTIKISEKQISAFRSLMSSELDPENNANLPLVNNFRPPQKLNNRLVQAGVVQLAATRSSSIGTNTILISMLLLLRLIY